MIKKKSLIDGIGNQSETRIYYDNWAGNYDQTLKSWNYKAPKKAANILYNLKKKINFNCGFKKNLFFFIKFIHFF